MSIKKAPKQQNYDFFQLKYTLEDNETYLDENTFFESTLKSFRNDENQNIKYIECYEDVFVGISYIEKVSLPNDDYYWAFCLSKVDTSKEASISDVRLPVMEGRTTYAETANEGPTVDTVIALNPHNGVVIIPRNNGGVSQKLLLKYISKVTEKEEGYLSVIINNTSLTNISNIDSIQSIEFSVKRIVDPKKLADRGRSRRGDRKQIDRVKARTMKCGYYASNLDISETIKCVRDVMMMNKDGNKEVTRMLINGTEDEETQVIDLVKNRLISQVDVKRNGEGKITINAMIDSLKEAYANNRKILMLDI
ncbi:DUF6731 family protein [Enterococcus hirae]|uniref:DUF6731 family protein n=1 Tax=Enterococcus hirae TaxID=1354 RepID=UPI000DEB49A1|nr:DUF6731 family protein [Enterococcus hirae]QNG04594.1 hypothetical protein FQ488_02260 [Enterococcus hirae]RBT48405.1 hypothetical protein EB20_01353 [Enterococcus hirae]RBT51408.1 hypothetical protein EB24_02946 [Enterococcus hirae]RBT55993.1 hypothetical protein EB10_00001 [Enterococcus hirae]